LRSARSALPACADAAPCAPCSVPTAGAVWSPRARLARVRGAAAAARWLACLQQLRPASARSPCTPHRRMRRRARAGDLLLEQQPYAAVVLDDVAACDACGRVADAGAAPLKRCTRCRAARYCSAECQARARHAALRTSRPQLTRLRASPAALRMAARHACRRVRRAGGAVGRAAAPPAALAAPAAPHLAQARRAGSRAAVRAAAAALGRAGPALGAALAPRGRGA
jgi:hypothetical protein